MILQYLVCYVTAFCTAVTQYPDALQEVTYK